MASYIIAKEIQSETKSMRETTRNPHYLEREKGFEFEVKEKKNKKPFNNFKSVKINGKRINKKHLNGVNLNKLNKELCEWQKSKKSEYREIIKQFIRESKQRETEQSKINLIKKLWNHL
ncbi:MAG: hypothetical protein ACE5GV_05995 [Candidatus Scalindua sp.]